MDHNWNSPWLLLKLASLFNQGKHNESYLRTQTSKMPNVMYVILHGRIHFKRSPLKPILHWCSFLCAQMFLQSGVTLCWVPSTLCSGTMAAMGPGEVARAGSGGTAACLPAPGGAYTSVGNGSEQPTGVRTQYSFVWIVPNFEGSALWTFWPSVYKYK